MLQGHLICTGCGESSQKGSSAIEPAPGRATADQEPEPAVQDRPAVEAPVVEAAEGGRVGLPLLLEEEEEEELHQGSGDMVYLLQFILHVRPLVSDHFSKIPNYSQSNHYSPNLL